MEKHAKRLSKEKWNEIRKLLKRPERNISAIARKYKVNRVTIYNYAWRRGWLEREEKKKGLWETIKYLFNLRSNLPK